MRESGKGVRITGKPLSRREFLRTLGRLGILAALGLGGARLLRGRIVRPSEACISNGICRGCAAFDGCGLPQALSAKERSPRAIGGG